MYLHVLSLVLGLAFLNLGQKKLDESMLNSGEYGMQTQWRTPASRYIAACINAQVLTARTDYRLIICSARSENLRILRIPEIEQAIWRLHNTCAQSQDRIVRYP